MTEKKLPEGWEWKKLTSLGNLYNGGTPSTKNEDYWNGDIPWVTGADITSLFVSKGRKNITQKGLENSATHLVPKKSILIVTRTGVGKIGIAENDIAFSQDITALVCEKDIEPIYVARYLSRIGERLKNLERGATIKGITRDALNSIKLPLPPLPTQRRIVAILEKAEETKKLRAQADELTNKLLQSVFLEMFGDPVRNEKGWETRKIGNVCKINMGQSPPGESYNKSGMGIPLLNGPTEFGDVHPTPSQWTDMPTKICSTGDILFCVRGATAGRMNWTDQEYCIGRGIAAIQAIPHLSESRYLYQLLLMNYGRFQATGRGSTFINISYDELSNLVIPIPPFPLQQKFASIVEKVESLRQNQQSSNHQIENLFNALMQKAFKGELTA
jgi:type I restriction enzyme S subunit